MTYFDHIKEESPFQTQRKFNVINHARIKMGRKRKVLLVKRSSVTDCQRRERGNPATIQGTTLQSNTHSTTVSFLLHCRQEAAFVVQFFKGFLYSVTNCPLTKQPNKALRNIPRKANSFIMRSNEISYLTTRIHKIFNNLFFIDF